MAESEDGLSDYLREEQELLEEEQPEEESPAMPVQVHADEEDDDGEAAAFPSVTPSPAASPAVSPAPSPVVSRAGSSSSSARRGRSRGSQSRGWVEEESNNEETEAMRIWRQANPQQGINSDDGVESSSEYGSTAFGTRQAPRPTLQSMSNYSTNISQILCNPDILSPVLPHGPESNGGWLEFGKIFKSEAEAEAEAEGGNDVEMRGMCPARAMCFNLPKSMFRQDADRLRDMRSNLENQSRATNINALFGLLWTPLSKGWKSGDHIEDHQNARNEQSAAGEDDPMQKKKKEEEVDAYMFYSQVEGGETSEVPMFLVAYEEVYAQPEDPSKDPSEIVAIRVWKFIFDPNHSDSALVSRLITENRRRMRHAGAAHCSNKSRSNKEVQEHNRAIKLVGATSTENVALEYFAGNQYLRVTSLYDLLNLIRAYGGKTDTFAGYLPVDLEALPPGALNHPMKGVPKFGGDSHLAPEWVFNAKRAAALRAGLVEFDSKPMDVCHEQVTVGEYFDDAGYFKIPEFCRRKSAFWIQTNPNVLHPYDMALPRPIAGIEAPGNELLQLFAELKDGLAEGVEDWDPERHPGIVNRFKNMCTGVDQTTAKMIREASDTIFSFDATEVSDQERKVASMAKAGAKTGFVGSFEAGAAVIEPRQVLKQLGDETSTVVRKLIAPWEKKKREEIAAREKKAKEELAQKLKDADGDQSLEKLAKDEDKQTKKVLKNVFQETQVRHVKLKKELFDWGAEKFLRAFTSRYDRDSIPTGYRAAWDGLYAELKDLEDQSACIAVSKNIQLTDSHKSVYSHAMNFLGRFFEHDCFCDGATGGSWRASSSSCLKRQRRQRQRLSCRASPAPPNRCG